MIRRNNGIRVKVSTVYVYDPLQADEYAKKAMAWAIKDDGKVDDDNGEPLDYSSKAYAIGGVGTEQNNAKYYAKEAAISANEAKEATSNYYTKPEIDDMIGDIGSVLDNINGEVV